MAEAIARLMGVSAIARGKEEAFERAVEAGSGELRALLVAMGAGACSLFRQGRYVFLYAELPLTESGEALGPPADEAAAGLRSAPILPNGDDTGESRAAQQPQPTVAASRSAAEPTSDPDAVRLQAERIWSVGGLRSLLDPWPSLQGEGEAYVLRMNDIFHDDRPMDDVPWRRPDWKPAARSGKLARLKPDMYGSYVYLHYQLQEEQPRLFSKYYTIGSFGPYIFSYDEGPGIVEPPRRGLLDSKQTPPDWPAVMQPHFEPWGAEVAEAEQLWRAMQPVFHLGEQA